VFDLIRSRKLASVKVGGSRRVTEQAIDDYIARLCHESEVA
jgi:excisionase family DNA binding protein